jgi:hypothetical protein
MWKRFGNWNAALRKAGIEPAKLVNVAREDLIQDLRAVVDALGGSTLTRGQYIMHGRFSPAPMTRAFGSWNGALRSVAHVKSVCALCASPAEQR